MTDTPMTAESVFDAAMAVAFDPETRYPCLRGRGAAIIQQYGDQRAAEERAKIVDWLNSPTGAPFGKGVTYYADAIERNEHD